MCRGYDMRFFSVRIVIPIIVVISIAMYFLYMNFVAIPSSILLPQEYRCVSRVVEHRDVLFIYGFKRLGYAYLCYDIVLSRYWENDPATALFLDIYIANYSAPWYVRGYSVKSSKIEVSIDGLPDYVWKRYAYHEGVTGSRDSYTLEIKTYISGYIAKKYNATLSIAIKVKVTEWSILGPYRTYELTLLNKTIPITIDIEEVYFIPQDMGWR